MVSSRGNSSETALPVLWESRTLVQLGSIVCCFQLDMIHIHDVFAIHTNELLLPWTKLSVVRFKVLGKNNLITCWIHQIYSEMAKPLVTKFGENQTKLSGQSYRNCRDQTPLTVPQSNQLLIVSQSSLRLPAASNSVFTHSRLRK